GELRDRPADAVELDALLGPQPSAQQLDAPEVDREVSGRWGRSRTRHAGHPATVRRGRRNGNARPPHRRRRARCWQPEASLPGDLSHWLAWTAAAAAPGRRPHHCDFRRSPVARIGIQLMTLNEHVQEQVITPVLERGKETGFEIVEVSQIRMTEENVSGMEEARESLGIE